MDYFYDLFDPEQYSEGTRKQIIIAAVSGFAIVSTSYFTKHFHVPATEQMNMIPNGGLKKKQTPTSFKTNLEEPVEQVVEPVHFERAIVDDATSETN